MIHINNNRIEAVIIPYYDRKIAFVIVYNKIKKKERIYVISYNEYEYIEKSQNKDLLLMTLIMSKVYGGKRNLQEVLVRAGGLFLYEIDKRDPIFIEFISKIVPNYNTKTDLIKQIIVNRLTTQ